MRELYDVDPETAIKQAFPEGMTPYQAAELARRREEFEYEKGDGSDATTANKTREHEIRDIMETYKVDRKSAVAARDNLTENLMAPSGRAMSVNTVTGQVDPIAVTRDPVERLPVGDQKTPNIDELAAEAGVASAVEDFIERWPGQLWDGLVSGDKARASTGAQLLKQNLISAFTVSSRPPVIEQERIEAAAPGDIAESPARAKEVYGALREEATRWHNEFVDIINSGTQTVEAENEMLSKLPRIQQIIERLRPPEDVKNSWQRQGSDQAAQAQPAQAATPAAPVSVEALQGQAKAMGLPWGDVQETAQKHGMSEQEVLDLLIQQAGGR
jgi:hypothetical protein